MTLPCFNTSPVFTQNKPSWDEFFNSYQILDYPLKSQPLSLMQVPKPAILQGLPVLIVVTKMDNQILINT